jgi:hypothetical protein
MYNMFYDLLIQAIEGLRTRKRLRLLLLILTPVVALLLTVFLTIAEAIYSPTYRTLYDLLLPAVFISIATFFVTLLSFTSIRLRGSTVDSELAAIRKEREEIEKRLNEMRGAQPRETEDIFDTVRLSLNQITEYYTINKSQAKNSFRASLFAVVAGLATIVGGTWIFYFQPQPDIKLTLISSIAGVLAEFIGAAYFNLHNKSLSQLNYFYETLVQMQNTMLAVKLCESLPEEKATELREKLIMTLIGLSPSGGMPGELVPNPRLQRTAVAAR